jgi:hypothetical protein
MPQIKRIWARENGFVNRRSGVRLAFPAPNFNFLRTFTLNLRVGHLNQLAFRSISVAFERLSLPFGEGGLFCLWGISCAGKVSGIARRAKAA